MNSNLEKIKNYLEDNKINYDSEKIDTLWKMFYWDYTERNPIDGQEIRNLYGQLDECLAPLSLKDINRVIHLTYDLCIAYQEKAFLGGVRVGTQWTMEVLEGNR